MRRRSLREPVEVLDLRFLKRHLSGCRRCLADSAVLRGVLDPVADALDAGRTAEAVLRRLHETPADEIRRDWGRSFRPILAAAAAVLLVASGVLVWRLTVGASRSAPTNSDELLSVRPLVTEAQSQSESEERAPDLQANERPSAPEGMQKIAAKGEDRRLLLPTGIRLLLMRDTQIVAGPDLETPFSVTLYKGTVVASVDPARQGPPFKVFTSLGQAEVKGTVFSVTADGVADRVEVLRGRVAVTRADGEVRMVSRGEGLSIKEQRVARLEDDATKALDIAFQKLSSTEEGIVDTLDLRGHPPAPTVRDLPTVRELLLSVRRHKSHKEWRQAVTAYRDLLRHHPSSPAAQDALVALGDLQLKHLNRPDLALQRFDQYLRRNGGTLTEEALVGKSRALRRLGRTAAERDLLERFAAHYPGSVHGPAVRARLEELKKEKNSGGPR